MGHNHISEMRYVRENQCPWLNRMSFKLMAKRAKVDVITYMSIGFFFVLARNSEHLQTHVFTLDYFVIGFAIQA